MAIERLAPIMLLQRDDQASILDHLLLLDVDDRCRRFGAPVRDGSIAHYVERLEFERDLLLGIRFGDYLVAFAHVGIDGGAVAELALSVLAPWRGHWLGRRLFEASVLRARSRNVTSFACAHGHPAVIRMAMHLGLDSCRWRNDPRIVIDLQERAGETA